MSCADLRPVIDLLGLGLGDAVEGDTAAAWTHLASCAACTARAASLGSAARALATAPAAPVAGDARRADLVARMAAAAAPEPRGGAGGWLALVLAVALAAGGALWAWRAGPLGPPDESSDPTQIEPGELAPSPAPVTSTGDDIDYASPDALEGPDPREAPRPAPAVPADLLPVGK